MSLTHLAGWFVVAAVALGCAEPVGLGYDDGAVESIDRWTDEHLDVYFIDGSSLPEDRIAAELEAAEQRIWVALYNLRSERLGEILLAKQHAGLDVRVLLDAKQMAQEYNTLDDELAARGLVITPILNQRSEYATLHHKLAVIDADTVIMGSANWGYSALHDNDESILVLESDAAAATAAAEFDQLEAGVKQPRPADSSSRVQLYFSPEDRPDRVIEALIDSARERIYVAVFSLRWGPLTDALLAARARGVEVYAITDRKQAATAWEDDRLRDAGIPVIEALNTHGEFTAMHHKFVVVDDRTVAVGAYNWTYTATFKSYEDLAVISDDVEVGAAFVGEFGRLWQRYGAASPPPALPTVSIAVEAWCDATRWGDRLVVVGNQPELGNWDPRAGLPLDAPAWPAWSGAVELPIGADVEYKLALLRADGRVEWERGDNRAVRVPTDGGAPEGEVGGAFRW